MKLHPASLLLLPDLLLLKPITLDLTTACSLPIPEFFNSIICRIFIRKNFGFYPNKRVCDICFELTNP